MFDFAIVNTSFPKDEVSTKTGQLHSEAKERQGFVCGNGELLLIVFRGTEPEKLKDWLTNIMIDLVAGPAGEVHKGFWGRITEAWPQIQQAMAKYRTNH